MFTQTQCKYIYFKDIKKKQVETMLNLCYDMLWYAMKNENLMLWYEIPILWYDISLI